jgi:cysteine desulfurase
VDEMGRVDPENVRRSLTPRTGLVSVMHANNEIGTVAPLAQIAAITRAAGVPLHTDAVQTVGALPTDFSSLGADLISLAAHKFYGPKGVGALIARRGVRLTPLLHGGGQERGRRAGTENVASIVGMAHALERARSDVQAEAARLTDLRDRLIRRVCETVPDGVLNGHPVHRLPNNAHISFAGVEGEALLLNLDLEGVCASAGSACSAGSLEPSHVMRALGRERELALGSIRFSLGRGTTEHEIDTVVGLLAEIVPRLRAGSRTPRSLSTAT